MATRLGPIVEQLNRNLWGWDPGINFFLLLPDASNVQSGLRTTDLI